MKEHGMLFRIMALYCNDQTTEDQRFKMWEAVDEPDEPNTPEVPEDDKPGA